MNKVIEIRTRRSKEVASLTKETLKQQIERVVKQNGLVKEVEVLECRGLDTNKLCSISVVPMDMYKDSGMLDIFLQCEGVEVYYDLHEVYELSFNIKHTYTDDEILARIINMLEAYDCSIIKQFKVEEEISMEACMTEDEDYFMLSYEDICLRVNINNMQPVSSYIYNSRMDEFECEEFVPHFEDKWDRKKLEMYWVEVTK